MKKSDNKIYYKTASKRGNLMTCEWIIDSLSKCVCLDSWSIIFLSLLLPTGDSKALMHIAHRT
ncbi:uncharacterized protein DS421_20g700700 [Arachis hypogaea]|nr:uncharacterized protein DS421_20g700700 [Arachis hypogaea]